MSGVQKGSDPDQISFAQSNPSDQGSTRSSNDSTFAVPQVPIKRQYSTSGNASWATALQSSANTVVKGVTNSMAWVWGGASGDAHSTDSTQSRGRRKVPLAPGHSLVDWRRYTEKLAPHDMRTYSMEEVAEHNTDTDLWIVLHNRVYDVTDYVPYHPGGVAELMRGAGKDATALFTSVHAFVNYEKMLEKHLIGVVSHTRSSLERKHSIEPTHRNDSNNNNNNNNHTSSSSSSSSDGGSSSDASSSDGASGNIGSSPSNGEKGSQDPKNSQAEDSLR